MNCWLLEHAFVESCGYLVPLSSFVRLRDCDGPLDPHHLVTQQQIKKVVRGIDARGFRLNDERNIVPVCRRHHDLYHGCRLRIPREALPAGVEDFAAELGLEWWLERQYGSLVEAA